MKKIFTILIFTIILLTSCVGKEKMGFNTRDKMNLQMADRIFECINRQDVDGLYNLFSEEVKKSDMTLASNIEKLYIYVNGNVESYKKFGISSKTSIEKKQNSTYYESQFKLIINGISYFLLYSYTVKNDFEPEKVGLKFIKMYKESDEEKYFCYWNQIEPGVFLPDEAK